MHVRVGESQHELAGLALPARFSLSRLPFPVSRRVADQRLRDPQPEALLPDTWGPLQQERLWQPAGGDGAYQPVSDPLMAVQGGDWHGGNLVWGGKWGRRAKRNTLYTKLLALLLGSCASVTDCMTAI